MKSIIQEAIAEHRTNTEVVNENPPQTSSYVSADDAELAKLAEPLMVNIRIVG